MGKYSLEKMYEIWNDRDGSSIEVGPDRDGLDLLEIRERSEEHKIINRITLTYEQADLLGEALEDLLSDSRAEKKIAAMASINALTAAFPDDK